MRNELGPDARLLLVSRDAPYSLCFSHMFRWARLRDAIASMKRKHRTTVRAERRLNAARAALDCLGGHVVTAAHKQACGGAWGADARDFCTIEQLQPWFDLYTNKTRFLHLSWDRASDIHNINTTAQGMIDAVADFAGVGRHAFPATLLTALLAEHRHHQRVSFSQDQTAAFDACVSKQRQPGSYLRGCDNKLWEVLPPPVVG